MNEAKGAKCFTHVLQFLRACFTRVLQYCCLAKEKRAIDKIAKEAAIKYAASCCLFSCRILSAFSPILGGFPFSLIPRTRICRRDVHVRDHDQIHILW